MWWRNRNVILILSILAALPAGQAAPRLEPLVLPALALVMTLALLEVSGASFKSARGLMLPVLAGLGLNFVVNGGLVLGLSVLMAPGKALFTGFVLIAAVPPAVAVVPFTALLRGDRSFAFLGTIGCYLAALIITPLMAVGLLGTTFIHPLKIFWILAVLIVLPLILSRLVRRAGWVESLERVRGPITNWSFALITYTIVGLNRELFLHDPGALLAAHGHRADQHIRAGLGHLKGREIFRVGAGNHRQPGDAGDPEERRAGRRAGVKPVQQADRGAGHGELYFPDRLFYLAEFLAGPGGEKAVGGGRPCINPISHFKTHISCHPERREGSQLPVKARFFAPLRMTFWLNLRF